MSDITFILFEIISNKKMILIWHYSQNKGGGT